MPTDAACVRTSSGLLSAAILDRRVTQRCIELGIADAETHASAVAKLVDGTARKPRKS